jgi:hypothetical protein
MNAQKSGVVIVNQAFAKQYFSGENPVGKSFETTAAGLRGARFRLWDWLGCSLLEYAPADCSDSLQSVQLDHG